MSQCPECGQNSSNNILCSSCGIVYASYFERKKEMRKSALQAAENRAASRKRTFSAISSAVLLTGVVAGFFVFDVSSKEHPANLFVSQKNVAAAQKSTQLQSTDQINGSGSDISYGSDFSENVSGSPNAGFKSRQTEAFSTCIEGNCVDGRGTYQIPNVGEYSGEWREGKRNGLGTFLGVNNSKYIGEWKNDKENGFGTLIDANGNKYVGQWENGVRQGQGVLLLADGSKYTGEFQAGKRNGYGMFSRSDNVGNYAGEWKDDKINGRGISVTAEGESLVGEFKDGQPVSVRIVDIGNS